MPRVYQMSMADIDPTHRFDYWREGARSIGGIQPHPVDRRTFEGHARMSALDRLKFGRITTSAHEARWTRELIRCSDDAFLRIVMQCKGTVEIEQGEARFALRPGQWTVLNATFPHVIRTSEAIEELIIIIPRTAMVPRLFDATRRLVTAHCAQSEMGRIVFAFARTVLDELSDKPSSVDEHLDGAALELVKALLQDRLGEQIPTTYRDVRVERIRAYIEQHVADPELSVGRIADAMGCSKRYVHSLFADGPSVHSLIWQTRLQRCMRDLQRPAMKRSSITTIALSHGFSCPAHFSRLFKTTYGMPPREFRNVALGSG